MGDTSSHHMAAPMCDIGRGNQALPGAPQEGPPSGRAHLRDVDVAGLPAQLRHGVQVVVVEGLEVIHLHGHHDKGSGSGTRSAKAGALVNGPPPPPARAVVAPSRGL